MKPKLKLTTEIVDNKVNFSLQGRLAAGRTHWKSIRLVNGFLVEVSIVRQATLR